MKGILLQIFSHIAVRLLRFKGASVGNDAWILGFPHIKVFADSSITIESRVSLLSVGFANPLSVGPLRLVTMAPGAKILLGTGSGVSSSRIIAYKEIIVGKETLIGADCTIIDSDFHAWPLPARDEPKCKAINIGNYVFIGTRCTILKGVTIGDHAVIGAGSVVSADIPAYSLAVGNPARIVRNIAAFSDRSETKFASGN